MHQPLVVIKDPIPTDETRLFLFLIIRIHGKEERCHLSGLHNFALLTSVGNISRILSLNSLFLDDLLSPIMTESVAEISRTERTIKRNRWCIESGVQLGPRFSGKINGH